MSNIMLERSGDVKKNVDGVPTFDTPAYIRYPCPLPEPCKEGPRVTTVVGFRCKQGIVLASDSQYTGTWKLRGPKIFDLVAPCVTACVAGAGTVSLIQKSAQLLREDFSKRQNITLSETVAAGEDCIKTVQERYINPYPDDRRPSLELLIGVRGDDFLELIKTDGLAATTVQQYAVLGSGGPLVEYIVVSLGGQQGIVEKAKIISVYAIAQAKEYDQWSGKETSVKVLNRDGAIEIVSAEEIRNDESYFDDLQASIHTLIVTSALPGDFSEDEVISYSDFKRVVRRFRESERARREKEERKRLVMEKWRSRHGGKRY